MVEIDIDAAILLGASCFVGGLVLGKLQAIVLAPNVPKPVQLSSSGSTRRGLTRSLSKGSLDQQRTAALAEPDMDRGHALRLLVLRFFVFVKALHLLLAGMRSWETDGVALSQSQQVLAMVGLCTPTVLLLGLLGWQMYFPTSLARWHRVTLRVVVGIITATYIIQDLSGLPVLRMNYKYELWLAALKLIINQSPPPEFAAQMGVTTCTCIVLHLVHMAQDNDYSSDLASEALYFMVVFPVLLGVQYAYLYLVGVDYAVAAPLFRLPRAMNRQSSDFLSGSYGMDSPQNLAGGSQQPGGRRSGVPTLRGSGGSGGTLLSDTDGQRRQSGTDTAVAADGHSSQRWVSDAASAVGSDHSGMQPSAFSAPAGGVSSLVSVAGSGGSGTFPSDNLQPPSPGLATVPSAPDLPGFSRGESGGLTHPAFETFNSLYLVKLCTMRMIGALYFALVFVDHLRRLGRPILGAEESGVVLRWQMVWPTIIGVPFLAVLASLNAYVPFNKYTRHLYARHSMVVNNFTAFTTVCIRGLILVVEPWPLQEMTVFRSGCFYVMTFLVQEDSFVWFFGCISFGLSSLLCIVSVREPEFHDRHILQVAAALPEYFAAALVGALLHITVSRGKFAERRIRYPAADTYSFTLRAAAGGVCKIGEAPMSNATSGTESRLTSSSCLGGVAERRAALQRASFIDPATGLPYVSSGPLVAAGVRESPPLPGGGSGGLHGSRNSSTQQYGNSPLRQGTPSLTSSANGGLMGSTDSTLGLGLSVTLPRVGGGGAAGGSDNYTTDWGTTLTSSAPNSAGRLNLASRPGSGRHTSAGLSEGMDEGVTLCSPNSHLPGAGSVFTNQPSAVVSSFGGAAEFTFGTHTGDTSSQAARDAEALRRLSSTLPRSLASFNRLMHSADRVAIQGGGWVSEVAHNAAAAAHPRLSRAWDDLVAKQPWVAQVAAFQQRAFATSVLRTVSWLTIWGVVILVQQAFHTPLARHAGGGPAAVPAALPMLMSELSAPWWTCLAAGAWGLLDLPRPPSMAVALLVPHRILLFYLHKCLLLRHCVATRNMLLVASLRLLLAVGTGYAIVGAYVHQLPRLLNLWAASLTVKGAPILAPLHLALWCARTKQLAKRSGLACHCVLAAVLGLLTLFCPEERERRRLIRALDQGGAQRMLQFSDALRLAVQRVRKGEVLAPDAPLFPGVTADHATVLLLLVLAASVVALYRVFQMFNRDSWYTRQCKVLTALSELCFEPTYPADCVAADLRITLMEHGQELFQDMTVAMFLAPTDDAEIDTASMQMGSLRLVASSRHLLPALDESDGRWLFNRLALRADMVKLVENDLATASDDKDADYSVLTQLHSCIGAASLLVVPLTGGGKPLPGATVKQGNMAGCLILLSPLPDAYDDHFCRLACELGKEMGAALMPELPAVSPVLSSVLPAAAKVVGLVPASQLLSNTCAAERCPVGLLVDTSNLLGSGSFGKVYKGQHHGRAVAVKMIIHTSRSTRLIENEVTLSKTLNHPHVVETFESINFRTLKDPAARSSHPMAGGTMPGSNEGATVGLTGSDYSLDGAPDSNNMLAGLDGGHDTDINGGDEHMRQTWIVMEYMDRGTLAKALRQSITESPGRPNLNHVLSRAREVASGIAYLHARNMIHGDLKSLNVLLMSDPAGLLPRGIAKIADFGLSRHVGAGRSHLSTRTYGTLTHMPRELLMEGRLTDKVDVYSFGILLWELLCRSAPYAGLTHGEIIYRKVNLNEHPPLPAWLPQPVGDLALGCWAQDPQQRPSFDEIVMRLDRLIESIAPEGTYPPTWATVGGATSAPLPSVVAAPPLPPAAAVSAAPPPVAAPPPAAAAAAKADSRRPSTDEARPLADSAEEGRETLPGAKAADWPLTRAISDEVTHTAPPPAPE